MKILIITNGGIGDQIHFSSLIRGLKEKHKDSEITIFCHPLIKFIYENDENVSNVVSEITNEEFDFGFNFALKNELLDLFGEISVKERVGFKRRKSEVAKTDDARIIQKGVVATNNAAKELLRNQLGKFLVKSMLSEWLCAIADVKWEKPYFKFKRTNEKYNSDIVLQYGTNVKEKNWSKEYYEELIKYFKKQKIWIIGHEVHRKDILSFQKLGIVPMIGEIELIPNVAELLEQSKLLISPDTGVAQIGIALGINTIILSNGYDRGYMLPKNRSAFENVKIIEKEKMDDISPQLVKEESDNFINEKYK